MQDGLIKNADRDPMDYKSLRNILKQDLTQQEPIITKIRNHLRRKLLHRTFRHETSQKERVLYEW